MLEQAHRFTACQVFCLRLPNQVLRGTSLAECLIDNQEIELFAERVHRGRQASRAPADNNEIAHGASPSTCFGLADLNVTVESVWEGGESASNPRRGNLQSRIEAVERDHIIGALKGGRLSDRALAHAA